MTPARFLPLVSILALIGCDRPPAEASRLAAAAPKVAVRVIDGDTIQLGIEVIRISNIDAPETGARAKCWSEAALGAKSKEALATFIGDGSDLVVTRQGKDQYGRTLALLAMRLGDPGPPPDIGEAMVTQGLASRWVGKRWDWCGPMDKSAEGAPFVGDVMVSGLPERLRASPLGNTYSGAE